MFLFPASIRYDFSYCDEKFNSDLPLATTLQLVGFTMTLMHLRVLIAVTTSLGSWNDYSAFEWRLCLIPKSEACIVFIIGSSVSVMRLRCRLVVLCFVALSFSRFGCFCFEQVVDRHSSSASTARSLDDFEHNIWNSLLNLLFLEQVCCIFGSKLVDVDLTRIPLSFHFALDFQRYKEDVFDSAR